MAISQRARGGGSVWMIVERDRESTWVTPGRYLRLQLRAESRDVRKFHLREQGLLF